MFKKFRFRSEFSRNAATLFTTTSMAQGITILSTPVLTRLYSPAEFGIFALFTVVTSIGSALVTGRYEYAIMLARDDEEAASVGRLSTTVAALSCIVLWVLIALFNPLFTTLLGNDEFSFWLHFVPATIFFTAATQILNLWLSRQRHFRHLGRNRVVQSALILGMSLSANLLPSGGLIVGRVAGLLLAFILLLIPYRRQWRLHGRSATASSLWRLAQRFRNFPTFDVPATMFNLLGQQLSHVIFNSTFGAATAGQFFLTQRILGLPISVVANTLMDIVRVDAAKEYAAEGHARKAFSSAFRRLAVLSILPSIALYFVAEPVIVWVFGSEWAVAGKYTRIMVPMFCLRFISSPLSCMFYIAEKQKLNMIGNLLLLALVLASFYFAATAEQVVIHLTAAFSTIYIIYLFFSARFAKII